MASSSESLRASSVAGRAVTLPKKGLAAEVGLGAWAERRAGAAAKIAMARKAGATARRKTISRQPGAEANFASYPSAAWKLKCSSMPSAR